MPRFLFLVFRKEIPHSIRVKPNDKNKIIIEKECAENETMQWFPSKFFYKSSGSKMDGNVIKLALKILEMREHEKTEEKEKKRLIDWMDDVMTEKLDESKRGKCLEIKMDLIKTKLFELLCFYFTNLITYSKCHNKIT